VNSARFVLSGRAPTLTGYGMRPAPSVLALAALLLAGCSSFTTRSDENHYRTGDGWGLNDRYYCGVKTDAERLDPPPPEQVGTGRAVLIGCDLVGCALIDTLCLPLDFYLNETDGQKRGETYSDKGHY